MPLSFLNPWFWLGALALAMPVWLHLRRKRETNLMQFSTLRFLEESPQARRSPWRLREVLLFALRALALLALVGAFAWPYLQGASTAPVRESRVYILDNTLSHQANSGFAEDRQQILRELSHAGPDVQLGVVELTSSPRVLVSFGEDRQASLQRLERLQPSFERGSYLAAFRQANAMLATSLGLQKRIVFLSDSQQNQWAENADSPAFLSNVKVDLPKPAAETLPNLYLSEPRVQRLFLGDKSLAYFTVKLTHEGPAKSANVSLRANGQLILNRVVELAGQPATILLQAQWEAEPGAWLQGEARVEGEPDALPADNQVFFSLAPVVEGKVALLAQSPYLRLALSPDIMRGQWAARIIEPARLSAEIASSQDADVLCLESGYLQSSEARKLVWRYLGAGRGVVLLVNRLTPAINECLRELGFEADGIYAPEEGPGQKFQFVFFNHPIFHPFLSSDYGNLMEIKVTRFARLKPLQAMPLVFGENGAGLFFQGTKFPGQFFVVAFGLDREQTSWPVHQTFIPFLDLAFQAARAQDPTPLSFEPSEIVTLPLAAGAASRDAELREGAKVVSRAAVEQGRAQIRMPERPGLYSLHMDGRDAIDKVFSINPPARESQLTYVESPDALRIWQVQRPPEAIKPAPSGVRGKVRLAAILQQRLWWWMLVGGITALLLETAWVEATRR